MIAPSDWDDFRGYVNPWVAMRAELGGEPSKVVRAAGSTLWDESNGPVADFTSGWGTQPLGHRDPVVAAALRAFLDTDEPAFHPAGPSPLTGRLARVLCERTGGERVIFASGGGEAVDAALKLARAATGRKRIVALSGAYHGCTYGAVAMMPPGPFSDGFAPHLPGVESLPFDDEVALDALGDDVAAIVVEPLQVEAGVRVLSPACVAALGRAADRTGALLIADEIQTGLGRCGGLLATASWTRRPDVVVLGKGLGGGFLPISAVVCRADTWERAYGSWLTCEAHASTWAGAPMACVAALSTLDQLDERCFSAARRAGERLRSGLVAAIGTHPMVAEVRGDGLLIGVALHAADHPWLGFEAMGVPELADRPSIGFVTAWKLGRAGFYAAPCGHDWTVVRAMPPLNVDDGTIDAFVAAFAEALAWLGERT